MRGRRAVGVRLGLEPARVVNCIECSGNTSAASVPLALAHDGGLLCDDARVLIGALGAGFTWGGVVLGWSRG